MSAVMARMLGAWSRPWCPICCSPAGPGSPARSRSKRQQKAREKRQWTRGEQQ